MMNSFVLRRVLPKRLRAQVALAISLLLAVTIGFYGWHMWKGQRDHFTAAAFSEAAVISKSIANLTTPYILTEDYASLESLLVRMSELPAVLSITVSDESGSVYCRVSRPDHNSSPAVSYDAAPVDPPGTAGAVASIAEDRIVAWHPVSEGGLLGWVRIDYSLHLIRQLERNTVRDGLLSAALAVAAAVVFILFFLNPHMRAVSAITQFAKRLHERKGAAMAARDGSRETDELVAALNQTSQHLYDKEAALRESERKFRTLFEESKDVIFFTTIGGTVLDVNQAGLELFGYTSKEELLAINLATHVYVNPSDRDAFRRTVERLGYIKDYEVRLKRKNGNPLTGLITAAVIYDDKGAAAGYRGILRDVTLQRQLEEQLRHAQKMEAVGQLTGGIAHDFNNILTAIIGFAYVLQSRLEEDSPLRSHAEVILASAEKAASLAQGLLAFSSRQVSNPKPVPLNDTVHRIRTLLLNLTGEHIRIGLNMSEENPVIMADSGQMDQVLMNLAVNARDAMPGGGMLSIETGVAELDTSFIAANGFGTSGRFALLKVSDTGSGMDEETLKRIFEPFFTTKEVGKGTGLGLSIIYGIVKQHKGYITVSSEPGRGTTFKIYLPLAEEKDLLQQNDEQAPDEQGTETILLAEDDRDLRLLMRTVLSELGYTLIDAVDGEDAIAKFREYRDRIDLLLFDVIMPKKNGREVYDEIKTMQPDVKVLFTSAYPAEIVEKRGVLDDGLPFVPKPVTPAVLLKRIREVLDAGSSR